MASWIKTAERMPPVGIEVKCRLQYGHSKSVQEYMLIHVDEGGVDWRTADEHSVISYDWIVTEWIDPDEDIDEGGIEWGG